MSWSMILALGLLVTIVLVVFKSWLFDKTRRRYSIFATIYAIQWFYAMVVTAYAAFHKDAAPAFEDVLVIIFGVATLIQLIFVYMDLHAIETADADKLKEYGPWVNMRFELLLRGLIVILLLLGVGKISLETLRSVPYVSTQLDSTPGNIIFNTSNSAAFAGLVLWNAFAFFLQRPQEQETDTNVRIKAFVTNSRIAVFALSLLFCLLYWMNASYWPTFHKTFSVLFVISYIIIFVIFLVLRYEGAQARVEAWLQKLVLRFIPTKPT